MGSDVSPHLNTPSLVAGVVDTPGSDVDDPDGSAIPPPHAVTRRQSPRAILLMRLRRSRPGV
ncbi:MAG: hypothetical protein ACLFWH_08830 [Actinomycetota bacterium]